MPRKPTKKRNLRRQLTACEIAYLSDDNTVSDDNDFNLWCYRHGMEGFDGDRHPRELWGEYKDEFLPAFIAKNPGKRPLAWWQWDAKRQVDQGSGCWYEGTPPEPRKRLGGIGTPKYEVLSYVPHFAKGIPTSWLTQSEEDYYTGRVKDILGHKVERNSSEGDFLGKAIDPNDPPIFESEAAYLKRHGLLTPEERVYITKHKELLEPETVSFEDDK